jgi:hypothetical protein
MRTPVVIVLAAAVAAVAAGGALAQEVQPPTAEPVIADGVSIDGIPVGGMTAGQAAALVQATFDRPVRFTFRTRTWQATPRQLGAKAYVDGAVAKAVKALPGEAVDLVVAVKGASVRAYATELDEIFTRPSEDALVRLVKLRPRFTKHVTGIDVRAPALVRSIVRTLRSGERGPVDVPADDIEPAKTPDDFGPVVVIRRESKQLYYYEGAKLVRKFGVATGQSAYPTPVGNFSVVDKQLHPWWYPPPDSDWAQGAEPIPPGPGNPLGTRWMGLSAPLVGIHGTPDASSIGYSASHGCIRMLISDAEWLFSHVDEGTPVFIRAV